MSSHVRGGRGFRRALVVACTVFLVGSAFAEKQDTSLDWLKHSIEQKLEKRGILKDKDVQVIVTDGKIVLEGTVKSVGDKRRAEKIAGRAMSSFVLDNRLMVAGAPVPDSQLAADVQNAVDNCVFYSVFDWITVSAKGGRVTLSGVTIDPRLGYDIMDVAAGVPGVKEVIDETEALPSSMRDDEIRHAAARAIYLELYPGVRLTGHNAPIHVIVADGELILEGSVRTELEKTEIENYVAYYAPTGEIVDNLVVSP